MQNKQHPESIRVACVGDSITYGGGVENREVDSYPSVLGRLLGPKFETRNFGVSGATILKKGDVEGDVPYWNQPEFQAVTDFEPNVVIIKLGTNDSKPQNWKYKAEFADDLRMMLDHFASLRGNPKIWVCLPVPVYGELGGINETTLTDEIIPLIRQVAREKHLPVIDLHTALGHRPEFFPDFVHPNAAGAAAIAGVVHVAITSNRPDSRR